MFSFKNFFAFVMVNCQTFFVAFCLGSESNFLNISGWVQDNNTGNIAENMLITKKRIEFQQPVLRPNFSIISNGHIQAVKCFADVNDSSSSKVPQNLNFSSEIENQLETTATGYITENKTCSEISQLKINPEYLNTSRVIRNGKKFKLIKVKKKFTKDQKTRIQDNQIKGRTVRLLPNLLSILPVKWFTWNKSEPINQELRMENETFWAKLDPVKNDKFESSLQQNIKNSEKIKKLLSLFTIVQFDKGECYEDGFKGTCLPQSECEQNDGMFTAICADGLGVCCYYQKTCGQESKENSTYFVNEGFPDSSTSAPKICALRITKAHSKIKQLRLDFEIFQLRDPINGTCLHDRFIVSGQDSNNIVPEICGHNTGHHLYIDVESSVGPFNLNVITVGEYFPRNFRIKITQIKKPEDLAPKNCLQYYTNPTGIVHSFNYKNVVSENADDDSTGYFNNLNYAICIKKLPGFCSVTYENDKEDSIQPTFQIVNVDQDGQKLIPPRQAGAETFDCPDDYIIANGIRLCGEKLNDASVEVDFTKNYPVTDTSNGPFVLLVRTDASVNGRGFYLSYTLNPCFG